MHRDIFWIADLALHVPTKGKYRRLHRSRRDIFWIGTLYIFGIGTLYIFGIGTLYIFWIGTLTEGKTLNPAAIKVSIGGETQEFIYNKRNN